MRLIVTFCFLLLLLFKSNNVSAAVDPIFSIPTVIDDDTFGQLGFTGNYAGISNTKSNLQFESLTTSTLIRQNDSNSVFEKLIEFKGNITSSCKYKNFIYLADVNHIIQFDTQTNQFQPLNEQALNGSVYTLYCDEIDEIIYVGGNFTSPVNTNSTANADNVASWNMKNNTWSLLPWKGFNGPVYTITKNIKTNTLLFGGRFDATGDGQYFNSNTSQLVSLGSPTSISSGNGALFGLNNNPNSIVCPAKASPEAAGQPWYLHEGVPGYWDANFANPVEPTVFRLSNTQTERGTISFNVLALGLNEYFNLSYVDPVTQQTMTCSEDCTLSNATYQDFTVLNPLSSTGVRININSWFGSGGGLGFVQIFQSDISVHPHLNTNNTQCNPSASSTQTTITGNWKDVYVYGYYQTVLVAEVPYSELSTSNTAIVYEPNIPAQGQYEVYATTPGCVGSSNCFTRTQVQYELQLSPGFPPTTIIADQNVYSDRRTLLYSGAISPVSSGFRPSITLRPAPNATQASGGGATVQIMADTIEFVRNMTSPPLVSILEYSPANATNSTAISWRPLNEQLPLGSTVHTIDASDGDLLYIGGLFSSANNTVYRNIVSYSNTLGKMIPLDDLSGVNGKVSKVLLYNSKLYVGGDFNSTSRASNASLLNYAARFDTIQKMWSPLGNGVDAPVTDLIMSNDNATITVSGLFNRKYTSSNESNPSVGNALWSTSNDSWIERSSFIVGQISAIINNDQQKFYAGSIMGAQTYRADLVTSSNLDASRFTFNNAEVITAGVTWINNATNDAVTIISRTNATTTNTSLVSMYSKSSKAWVDIDSFQGQVYTLATFNNWLYVGGQFTPQTAKNQSSSLAIYDLASNNRAIGVQSVLDNNNNPGTVKVIKIHPDGKRVLIGGQFSRVGLLDCDAVCVIDPKTRQWDQVAIGMTGTVNDILTSNSDNKQKITVIGDLKVQNQQSNMANLLDSADTWATASNQLPGMPTTVINSVDEGILVAGSSATNASGFYVGSLQGQDYTSLISNLGPGSNISQLLLVPISSSSEERYPSGTQNMLLAVGSLNITGFGSASSALYNGDIWHPYLITTEMNGLPGTINGVIHVTDFNGIKNGRRYLSVAAVILISIAISTGILFAMSAAGLLFLFKQHKNARGPDSMPPWTPSNRLVDALGLFGTGSLGAATIAATAAGGGGGMAAGTVATGRNLAGPSNTTTSRSAFQHDTGDMGVSPTTTIVNPIPITAAAAAAGILSFDAMVASAKSNAASNVVSETHPKLFHAKYPFKAQEYGELSLDAGDEIVVTDTTDNIWWLGYKDGGGNRPVSGVFPSNYVKS